MLKVGTPAKTQFYHVQCLAGNIQPIVDNGSHVSGYTLKYHPHACDQSHCPPISHPASPSAQATACKVSLPNIKMENQVSSSTHQHLNIDTIRDSVVEAESDISQYASRIAFFTSTMNHASKEELPNILDKMETAKNLLLELFFDVEVLREKNGEPEV